MHTIEEAMVKALLEGKYLSLTINTAHDLDDYILINNIDIAVAVVINDGLVSTWLITN